MVLNIYAVSGEDGGNSAQLSGWIYVESVVSVPMNGKGEQKALSCILLTKRPPIIDKITPRHLSLGYRVILAGGPMVAFLDKIRQDEGRLAARGLGKSKTLPRVVIRGPLKHFRNGACQEIVIEIKFVDFLDISTSSLDDSPLDLDYLSHK